MLNMEIQRTTIVRQIAIQLGSFCYLFKLYAVSADYRYQQNHTNHANHAHLKTAHFSFEIVGFGMRNMGDEKAEDFASF